MRGVPAGAQAAVERVTEDVAAGRDTKVYEEAADEWRATVSAEESARALARVRERLGRVESRSLHQGREQQSAAAPLSGHTLELVYETRFERGTRHGTLHARRARRRLAARALLGQLGRFEIMISDE